MISGFSIFGLGGGGGWVWKLNPKMLNIAYDPWKLNPSKVLLYDLYMGAWKWSSHVSLRLSPAAWVCGLCRKWKSYTIKYDLSHVSQMANNLYWCTNLYLGPMRSPTKFVSGWLSWGMKTLSSNFLLGGLQCMILRHINLILIFNLILGSEEVFISVEGSLIDLDLDGNLTILLWYSTCK